MMTSSTTLPLMQGKTVLVTGGTSGIGQETAIGLAKLGAQVVHVSPEYDTVTAAVATSSLTALSAARGVRYVTEVLAPQSGQATSSAQAAATRS